VVIGATVVVGAIVVSVVEADASVVVAPARVVVAPASVVDSLASVVEPPTMVVDSPMMVVRGETVVVAAPTAVVAPEAVVGNTVVNPPVGAEVVDPELGLTRGIVMLATWGSTNKLGRLYLFLAAISKSNVPLPGKYRADQVAMSKSLSG